MKSVLISIQPKWVEKIASGQKTIEVRKTRPNIEIPFKCYIYMTATKERCRFWEYITAYQNSKGDIVDGSQKVIGEFICDWVTKITPHCDIEDFVNQYIHGYPAILGENDCLSFQEMKAYLGNKNGYDWHISDLKIYDKPKELSEFRKLKERIERTCGCLSNNGLCNAARYEELCDNIKKCCFKEPNAPQSWCYVEEL